MVAGQRKEDTMIQKNWQELIKPNKIEFSSKKKTLCNGNDCPVACSFHDVPPSLEWATTDPGRPTIQM